MKELIYRLLQVKRTPKDILFLFLLVLLFLWWPSYLTQELNLFEWGLYLPGIEAVTHGQVPFKDFFHLRGPFELYVPALFMKIFGFRADVLASYFYFGTVLTILVTVLIAYELIEKRVLLYSFVLILVTRTFPRVVFTFWGGMRYAWGLLAILCLIKFLRTKRHGWLVASGVFSAIGAWTSIEIGVIAVFSFMIIVILDREYRRSLWVFLAGFSMISAPYVIYLFSQNAWFDYMQAQWVVVTQMQKTFLQIAPVPDTVPKFLHAVFFPLDRNFFRMTPMYCYIFFFCFYFWRMINKKNTVLDQAALVVAVYALMVFFTGFRNLEASVYEMSLQPEKIVLFYLLGHFIIWVQGKFERLKWLGPVLISMVVVSSLIYTVGRFKTRFYKVSWVHELTAKDKKKASLINGSPAVLIDLSRIKHMTVPVWQAADLYQLRNFLDKHVPPDETLWMYPELGSLNFMLQRPWVGRFPMASLSWMDDAWFADYESALKRKPPRYAIVNKTMPFYFDEIYFLVPANRIKHERIMRFLRDHYVAETQTPSYFVYRRIS